jgi:hypothetical protein
LTRRIVFQALWRDPSADTSAVLLLTCMLGKPSLREALFVADMFEMSDMYKSQGAGRSKGPDEG